MEVEEDKKKEEVEGNVRICKKKKRLDHVVEKGVDKSS